MSARQFRPRWVLATGLVPLNADALASSVDWASAA